MKLISLNTWGGKYFGSLIKFIQESSKDTDIFCLQEIFDTTSDVKDYKEMIRANLLGELKTILKKYKCFYFPIMIGYDFQANSVNFDLKYGQTIFIKKDIKVEIYKKYFIFKSRSDSPKKDFSNLSTPLQQIQFSSNNKTFSIFNFHGTSSPTVKKDTPKRLEQSKKVKAIIDKAKGVKILAGDFNLSIFTKSIKLFEKDMLNLIKKFKVQKTRSKLSPFYGKSNFQKFADYTFVSRDVKVISFEVLDIKVSDHLPMVLEFS